MSGLRVPIILFNFFSFSFSKPMICWHCHLTSFSLVENGWEPWMSLLANCTSASICFPAVSTEAKLLPFSPTSHILCQTVDVKGNLKTACLSSLLPQTIYRHLYSIFHCKILQLFYRLRYFNALVGVLSDSLPAWRKCWLMCSGIAGSPSSLTFCSLGLS